MFSTSFTIIALASAVSAFTPAGFEPSSFNNFTVAFGTTLATNGVNLPKALTQSMPTLGTSVHLSGTYTLMMVDPDIPPSVSGNSTSEFLHWLQGSLVSSLNSTTIAGVTFFPLTNPNNVAAYASYIGPAPPNEVPHTHRYTQLLINTTLYEQAGNSSVLKNAGLAPTNFNAVQVLKNAGLTVLAGNSFNVSNPDVGIGNATMLGSGNAKGNSTTSAAASKSASAAGAGSSTVLSTTTVDSSPTGSGAVATAANGAGRLLSDGLGTLGMVIGGLGAVFGLLL